MPVSRFARGAAMALGLLAAVGIAGCTGGSAPVTSASGQPASFAASAPPASATAVSAPSPAAPAPAATSSAAPGSPGEVKNLVVTPSVRSELLAAYAAFRTIPASDVQGVPGSVYYAYQPATGTYWAKAHYEPASGDSQAVAVGFQDGGGDGFYKKTVNGSWLVSLGGEPGVCYALKFFPLQVLAAWSQPTSVTPASIC